MKPSLARLSFTASALLFGVYASVDGARAESLLEKQRLFDSESRTVLENKGVTLNASYTADLVGNVSGGIKDGWRGLDLLSVNAEFDGEKLFGLKGFTAYIEGVNSNGGRPNGDLVGSIQGVNSIETVKATAKLYQAWIQQEFLEGKVSVLAGLYDLNTEFYSDEPAALFPSAVYGMGTDLAASGVLGAPTFPFTATTLRVKVKPTQEWYVQAAAMDGIPGNPRNPNGTQLILNRSDGLLYVAEAGYMPGGEEAGNGKIALGGWAYSQKYPDNAGGPSRRNYGVYVTGNYKVYREPNAEDQGLSVFARLGYAEEHTNPFGVAWAGGAVYKGIIPGRDEGQLGLAVGGAHDTLNAAGAATEDAEYNVELTYSDNLTPWLMIQPSVQYVANPGLDPALDNAVVTTLRAAVQF